jgi:hypothetical protein
MFAKLTKVPIASVPRAASPSARLAHSNDSTKIVHTAVGLHWPGRQILPCHWRPMVGGDLECFWGVETAEGAATEEPDQRWIGASRLFDFAYAA